MFIKLRYYYYELLDYGKIISDAINIKKEIGRYKGVLSPLSPCISDPGILASHKHEVASLKSALDSKQGNVKNIAVAGPYGAGKSTFILSFERYHSKYKFLNISLATFLETVASSTNTSKNTPESSLNNNQIEESIVQHILYKEHPSKTPASSYKRIPHSYPQHRALFSVLVFLTMLSSVFLHFQNLKSPPEIAEKIVDFLTQNIPHIEMIALLIIGGCSARLIYWFSHIALTFDFKRVFSKDGAIAVSDESSPLNQHLDEIIYFFFKTDYNVVVFEDLDRFNNVSIFTKLREINHLINQSNFINQEVKFIYAIKDELLSSKERTKFFDIIIPILPIVLPNNALSLFQKELAGATIGKERLLDLVEPVLLKNVARYIDDMRILKNICNEFFSYITKLNKNVDCDRNKIFAMVVFKNLCPLQHSELLTGKGVIVQVFKSLDKAKSNDIISAQKKVSELKHLISEKNKLNITNMEDVYHLYWSLFMHKNDLHNHHILHINMNNGEKIQLAEVFLQEGFETLLESSRGFSIIDGRGSIIQRGNNLSATYRDIDDSRPKNYKSTIEQFKADTIAINKRISELERVITRKNQENLTEYLNDHNLSGILNTCECAEKCECCLGWLKQEEPPSLATSYLLIEGYLAEDYQEYLSVFVEGALTASDKIKINSIRAGHPLEAKYKFTKLESVVEDLSPRDFRVNANLNHQLLQYFSLKLYADPSRSPELALWEQSFDKNSLDIKYISQFIIDHFSAYSQSKLINVLYRFNFDRTVSLFEDLPFDPLLTKLVIENLKTDELANLFETISKDVLLNINNMLEIKLVCDKSTQYKKLSEIGIKFNRLSQEGNSQDEFKALLEYGIFDLNLDMVLAIRNSISNQHSLGDPDPITFAQIEELNAPTYAEKFLNIATNNPKNFIQKVLMEQDTYSEPLGVLIEKLNTLDVSLGCDLIKASDTIVEDLELINNLEHLVLLLKTQKVKPIWKNIELCLTAIHKEQNNDQDNDSNLAEFTQNFMNSKHSIVELIRTSKDLNNLESDFILFKLLDFNHLSDEAFDQYLSLFPKTDMFSDPSSLTVDKANQLIPKNLLYYSNDIVEWLVSNEHKKLTSLFISQYPKEYLEDADAKLLTGAVFAEVLHNNNLSDELKLSYTIDILFPSYSSIDETESLLPFLLGIFESLNFKVVCSLNIPFELVEKVLGINDTRLMELKTKILAAQIDKYDWDGISSTLIKLNPEAFNRFTSDTGNISLPKDKAFNYELLHALNKTGFIGAINNQNLTITGYKKNSRLRT